MKGKTAYALRPVFVLVQLVLLVSFGNAHENTDSLDYALLKDSLVSSVRNQAVLQTAEELAREELFAEAAALIRDFLPEDEAERDSAKGAALRQKGRWHISSGADYYHIEDVDSAVLTSEELRDYNRLIETPLSVWAKARLAWDRREGDYAWDLRPVLLVSERKASLDVPFHLCFARERIVMEGAVGAAKWFREDASDTLFEPLRAQSSDMGKGSLRIAAGGTHSAEKQVRWTVPVSVDWEHYRKNRTGYESCVEYGLSPLLEWRTKNADAAVRALADCRYQDYYNEGADSLDVLRLLGRIDGDLRYGRAKITPSIALLADRYTAHERLIGIGRLDAAVRVEQRCGGRATARLYCRYVYEQEKSRVESGVPPLLDGDETTVRPSIKITVSQGLVMEPECSAEMRRSEVRRCKDSLTRCLWEARRSCEPGIRCAFNRGAIDAAFRCAFRFDDSRDAADSRVCRLGVETSAVPFVRMTFNLFADYQYRVYAPYSANARRAESITASMSMAVKL